MGGPIVGQQLNPKDLEVPPPKKMQVFGLNAGFARLFKYSNEEAVQLSAKARFKHQVLDLVRRSGGDVRLACQH